jgi:hypothetical protein
MQALKEIRHRKIFTQKFSINKSLNARRVSLFVSLLCIPTVFDDRFQQTKHGKEKKNERQRDEDPMQEEAGLGQPRIVQFRQGLEPGKKGRHKGE